MGIGDKMNYKLNSEEKKEVKRIFDENGYNVTNCEKLISELESNGATYIGEKDDVVSQFIEVVDIKTLFDYLDEDLICANDLDWEELSNKRFLNTYRLFEDREDLEEFEKKGYIKKQ